MSKFSLFTLLFLIFISPLAANDIPEPYRSVRDLPFDSQGWFQNQIPIANHLASRNIKTAIEIGSWIGESTRFIANRLPEGSVLYAVDTWLGSTDESLHQLDPRLPYLYQLFLSNVKHAQLCHKIIPVRMKSLEAANGLNVMADLIYLDAGHSTEDVYNDIHAWIKHLNAGGLFCGDDWAWDSVRVAVEMAAKDLNKQVYSYGNYWWYE